MNELKNELFYLKLLINSSYGVEGTSIELFNKRFDIKKRINLIESRKFKIKKIFNG
jgi:hypothetical protein